MNIVHLTTESGKWKYNARRDDEFFGEYLSSLEEVGELPESIVFHASLAEVIESEWESAMLLVNWIKRMKHAYFDNESDLLMNIPAVARLVPLSDTWEDDSWGSTLPGATLSDVLRISNIVTLPDGWRMYVMLGEGVSNGVMVDHILAAGKDVLQVHGDDDGIIDYIRGSLRDTFEGSVIPYIQDAIETSDEEEVSNLSMILYTLARDTAMTLLTKNRNTTAITPLDMRWDLVLKCMEKLEMSKESLAWVMATTFLGQLHEDIALSVLPLFTVAIEGYGEASIDEGGQVGLLSKLYSLLFPALADEMVKASFLFLSEAIPIDNTAIGMGITPYNEMFHIPAWINMIVGTQLTTYINNMNDPEAVIDVFQLDSSNYNTYIYLLDHFVAGRGVLDRVATMRHNAADSVEWTNFVLATRRYIGTYAEVTPSPYLPSPADIARARKLSR